MCGTAADAVDAQDKLSAAYAHAITRFTFVWNAFEILVSALQLEPHPTESGKKRGSSAKAATWFLKTMNVNAAEYLGYAHLWEHAELMMPHHPDLGNVTIPARWDRPYINEAGYGLEMCRVMRNRLAHGIARLPYPEDYGGYGRLRDAAVAGFVNLAVKLLLISIQMLVVCRLDANRLPPQQGMLLETCGEDVLGYLRSVQLEGSAPPLKRT